MEDTDLISILVEQVLGALPLVAAAIVPVGVAYVRKFTADRIPPALWPAILTIGGAVVATVSQAVGFDLGDFNPQTADLSAWETAIAGALTGLGAVGVHQGARQLREWYGELLERTPD